jgi:hypothetical protein
MARSIQVFNPVLGDRHYLTEKRAAELCRKGKAFLRPDGQIQFRASIKHRMRREIEAAAEEAREFTNNRGKRVYWNGARSKLDYRGRDQSTFPPGSNVAFPKTDSAKAARRYCRSSNATTKQSRQPRRPRRGSDARPNNGCWRVV